MIYHHLAVYKSYLLLEKSRAVGVGEKKVLTRIRVRDFSRTTEVFSHRREVVRFVKFRETIEISWGKVLLFSCTRTPINVKYGS